MGLLFLWVVAFIWSLDLGKRNLLGEVIFLDVGQGDSALIKTKEKTILFDAGKNRKTANQMSRFFAYFQKEIDYLILSHSDLDHYGGISEILKIYEVKNIVIDDTFWGEISEDYKEKINKENCKIIEVKTELELDLGEDNFFKIFNFGSEINKLTENDSSLLGFLKIYGLDFYFMSDAGFKSEEYLEKKNINFFRGGILKVGHHGSKNSTSTEFLKYFQPVWSVISVGKNSYGHPHQELISRLQSYLVSYFRTDESGDIIFRLWEKIK